MVSDSPFPPSSIMYSATGPDCWKRKKERNPFSRHIWLPQGEESRVSRWQAWRLLWYYVWFSWLDHVHGSHYDIIWNCQVDVREREKRIGGNSGMWQVGSAGCIHIEREREITEDPLNCSFLRERERECIDYLITLMCSRDEREIRYIENYQTKRNWARKDKYK